MWSKVAKFISQLVPKLIKDHLVKFVMKLAGLSGGIWAWVIGKIAIFAWKKADKEIQSGARVKDQENVDEKLNEKYQEDMKNGASEEILIEDETAILNGGHHR